ncbi:MULTISPECIES: anti-sigma factor family protein [Streptomycetaceae]|uniref:anti-sigma factor family protein n=1 Tax=Streptomycetaceae TaxID=2062 RepID=UPI0030095F19
MTSAPENGGHPEVAEISDLTEDLLPPEQAAQVRRHLAGCPTCADVLTALTEISGLLGELPVPEPMPADVAARIDAALVVEAAAESSAADVPQRDVPRGTSAGGASRVPRGTSTFPAAPDGRPAAGTGPGRAGRTRRRSIVLAAGLAAGAVVLGGVVYGVVSAGSSSSEGSSTSDARRVASAQVSGSIEEQVRQLLATPYSPNRAAGGDGGTTVAPDLGNTPMIEGNGTGPEAGTPSHGQKQDQNGTDAPSCVLKATQRSETPLAVGADRFQGTASYLVVLPHPADSSQVDAYVVDASCSAGSPGTVLFQSTYPRR